MHTGIWTPWNEEWFKQRQAEIRRGEASPRNVRKWRSALGQYRPCAKLIEVVNEASEDIVDKQLGM